MYEIRWFFEGEVPLEFQQFLTTNFNLEKDRIDYYLPILDIERGGKIRGDLLEIKDRNSHKEISGRQFSGFIETWLKSVEHTSEKPDGVIEVNKKRWKTLFSFYDDTLEPTSIPSQMSLNVEYSFIHVNEKPYHTLCFESIMDKSVVTRAMDEFLTLHPVGTILSTKNSMGYPEFLFRLSQ